MSWNNPFEPGNPVFIIAEMSANHHQDFDRAVKIIHAAKKAGADAIKLQTYTADTITLNSQNEYFQIQTGGLWDGQTLHDLYQKAYTPWEWHAPLKKIAEDLGLVFFSAAFDPTAVDFLEDLKVPMHKAASFEIVDIPLIEKMAQTGKPLILSTGMASFEEISEAVTAARNAGARQIALLKCTSAYPASPADMNLKTIPYLSEALLVPVGISDHTRDLAVPVTAVALGARIIEKHFILSRSEGGPDGAFSLEPDEFAQMVRAVRDAEAALGKVEFAKNKEEDKNRVFRRSLFVVQDVKAGEIFTEKNVRSIRPAHGLPPKRLKEILGQKAACDISAGTPLRIEHLHACPVS